MELLRCLTVSHGKRRLNCQGECKNKNCFHYGFTDEDYLVHLYARRAKWSTRQVLLQLHEWLLDSILFQNVIPLSKYILLRLCVASTVHAAHQIVNYQHILVNDILVITTNLEIILQQRMNKNTEFDSKSS